MDLPRIRLFASSLLESIGQDLIASNSIVATDTPGFKTGYILSIGQDLIASNSMVATDTP